MKNHCAIVIEAPIQRVFAFIHNDDKHRLWLEELEETIYEPDYDPDHPLGAKFQQKIREGKAVQLYDGEVTAFKKPSHLGVRLTNKSFSVQVDYRLKSVKRTTHVDFNSEFTFKNLAVRTMMNLARPLMHSVLQKQMKKLKEIAEAGD
jgi:hypothetical protein